MWSPMTAPRRLPVIPAGRAPVQLQVLRFAQEALRGRELVRHEVQTLATAHPRQLEVNLATLAAEEEEEP